MVAQILDLETGADLGGRYLSRLPQNANSGPSAANVSAFDGYKPLVGPFRFKIMMPHSQHKLGFSSPPRRTQHDTLWRDNLVSRGMHILAGVGTKASFSAGHEKFGVEHIKHIQSVRQSRSPALNSITLPAFATHSVPGQRKSRLA